MNGAVSSSTAVTVDGNVGTIAVGDVVTGTGITGIVTVATVNSQTSIVLDTAVTLSDDSKLKFDGSNILFIGALDTSKTIASGKTCCSTRGKAKEATNTKKETGRTSGIEQNC